MQTGKPFNEPTHQAISKTMTDTVQVREGITAGDILAVRDIAGSSGFFRKDEIEVAVGLAQESLEKGGESGYHFLFADLSGKPVGFICFGPIPCTIGSFDIYWMAVMEEIRGQGLGNKLLGEAERAVTRSGGRMIYIETSSTEKYEPTRRFYLKAGYVEEARLKDFYLEGDDKLIYSRAIPTS